MSQEPQNHKQMLAEVRRSQDAVRDRVSQGSWRYDLLYSSVAAVMVAGQAAPMPFNILASTGAAVAFALMWRSWSDKAGVSITGYSPKRPCTAARRISRSGRCRWAPSRSSRRWSAPGCG
jgi:hypothetical protein